MQSGGNRSGRKLHKSRSIPLNLLTSPSPKLQRHDTTASHAARIKSISPPRHSHQPRRTASFGDLLASPTVTQQPPTSILQTSPTYTAPRPAPIPAHLPVPEELTSKFSGSSGESKLDPSTWEYSLRARARTISQAVSFKSLKKTPSKLTLRKKNSLATLFDGVAVNGSSRRSEDDKSKAADFKSRISTEERRSIASSKIPTSSRNSTSSYSQPPSSPSVLDSGGKHRRGFLRNALKDLSRGNSLRGPRSESRSSHARSASNSSVSVVGSASKRASDISSKDSGEKKGWVSRLGKAVSGKRVAAKVEHFEAAMNSPIDSPTPMVHLAERVRIPGSGEL